MKFHRGRYKIENNSFNRPYVPYELNMILPINVGSYMSLMCYWKVPQGLIYKVILACTHICGGEKKALLHTWA